MESKMDEKDAELLRSRSRAAFDAQAPTYDTGTGASTQGASTRTCSRR